MRVAFVLKDNAIAEPLGIMYLSSLLKATGVEARLFVASKRDWLRNLKDYQPAVVAYSVISGSHRHYLGLNRLVRDEIEALSLFGGPHTTFFPETIYQDKVDVICIGEGEYPLLELVRNLAEASDLSGIGNLWIKRDGTVHKNPVRPLIQHLDDLPFPDREIIYGEDPYLRESKIKRFLTNRGCPFNCTYCFNRAYKDIYRGERMIRWRSVDNLIGEIEEVRGKYPLELVRFIDDIFILPPLDWLEAFTRVYRRRITLPFVCNVQVKTVTEDKVKLLKEAGCAAVYMAIETGNEGLRNRLLDRRMTNAEILKAFDLVHSYGISIAAENILGLPGGSLQTDMETVQLNTRCRVDNPVSTIFQPYPKTGLGEYAVRNGFFGGDFDTLSDSYFGGSQLRFSSRSEKTRIENLHKFFGLAVCHPFLLPLIRIILRLPPNRIFGLFHRLWDSYCKRRKIFRVKLSFRDYLLGLKRVLRY
jgi:anaerobic magnesium-protoporphyrin IX monomethyl ester cyclase